MSTREYDHRLVLLRAPEVGELVWYENDGAWLAATISSISRVVSEARSPWSDIIGRELWMPDGFIVWLKPSEGPEMGRFVEIRFTENMRSPNYTKFQSPR